MNDIINFLIENPTGILATIGADGKPKARPFTFFFEAEGKLWFQTSNEKSVYRELISNPHIEFCFSGSHMSWLRLSGKAVFEDRMDIKVAMFEKTSNLSFLYKSPQNPVFEVFYLESAKAILSLFRKDPIEFNLN